MRKVDKMQKRGKHISEDFERPEGTQEDVAEMDGLRNCGCETVPAASFSIKHFSEGENMLVASGGLLAASSALSNQASLAQW